MRSLNLNSFALSTRSQTRRRPTFISQLRSLTLGIRQEDPARIWERRAPLTPDAVNSLIHEDGVDVLIQPCARRVYPISSYLAVSLAYTPPTATCFLNTNFRRERKNIP